MYVRCGVLSYLAFFHNPLVTLSRRPVQPCLVCDRKNQQALTVSTKSVAHPHFTVCTKRSSHLTYNVNAPSEPATSKSSGLILSTVSMPYGTVFSTRTVS